MTNKTSHNIFVRYRHGTLLPVPTNLSKSLKEAATALKSTGSVDSKIKQIADGNGWGISAESTWFQMIKECTGEFRRNFPSHEEEWKKYLQQYLNLISTELENNNTWSQLKDFLHRNINFLSGWQTNPRRLFNKDRKVMKVGNEYYYEEKGDKIQIIGERTETEERSDYIANNITSQYGILNILLRIFAIRCIEKSHSNFFPEMPKSLKVVLSESPSGTSFLYWQWHIEWPYQLRIAKWRPPDRICDPEWLANDLIAHISEKESLFVTDGYINKSPELHERWLEKFGSAQRQSAFALETNLQFGNEEEAWIDFRGHTYRWLNQNESLYPTVISTHLNNESDDEVQLRTYRFLSQLSYEFDLGIEISFGVISIKSIGRQAINPKRSISVQYPDIGFRELVDKGGEKLELALSFYREGNTSKSPYYSFLCFYKIIQLTNDEIHEKVSEWLEKEAPKFKSYIDIKKTSVLEKFDGSLEKYFRKTSRNALSHVNPEKNEEGIIDPDQVSDQKKIRIDLILAKDLARHAIKTQFSEKSYLEMIE